MTIQEEILTNKEGGKRKVLRLRFLETYGWDEVFIVRTLNRGEILDAFTAAGYPGRSIPENKRSAQAIMEDRVLTLSAIHIPTGFNIRTCPAGIPSTIAKIVLDHSGFTDSSAIQKEMLRLASEYANSPEGRGDGLILTTIPNVTLYDLEQMNTYDWAKVLAVSINIQKDLYGRIYEVSKYLDPTLEIEDIEAPLSPSRPQLAARTNPLDSVLKVPDRIPGLRNSEEVERKTFKSTNNLTVKDGQKIIDGLLSRGYSLGKI